MPQTENCITGNAIYGYRAKVCLVGMRSYLESNGRTMLSSNATPAALRAIATEITGIPYPKSRKGLERAYADISELMEGKGPDEIGEVRQANR